MTKRPRAADVAALAGVSTTAVSFVLNGHDSGNISAATRDRILQAAADLGYRPNRVAQSLRSKRTHVLGMVTDSIASSPFAGRLLGGAVERAGREDHVVMVFDTHAHAEREQAAVDEFASRQVDGLIYATMGFNHLDALPETRLPMVLANCVEPSGRFSGVAPDDERGGALAATTLIDLGHRRIAMLGGTGPAVVAGLPTGNISGPLRANGFRAAAAARGLNESEASITMAGWEIGDGARGAMRVLAGPDGMVLPASARPTAIFAVTDRVATGVLLSAARLGLEVPADLSVLGFDDQESVADQLVPALSTLALPHALMGEMAVDLLLATLADPELAPRQELLECPLVERETLAPPA